MQALAPMIRAFTRWLLRLLLALLILGMFATQVLYFVRPAAFSPALAIATFVLTVLAMRYLTVSVTAPDTLGPGARWRVAGVVALFFIAIPQIAVVLVTSGSSGISVTDAFRRQMAGGGFMPLIEDYLRSGCDCGADRTVTVVTALLPAAPIARRMAGSRKRHLQEDVMNLLVIRQSIAGPVAVVAVALAPLAGLATTIAAGTPVHAAAQLTSPTRFTPPDPCRSAC